MARESIMHARRSGNLISSIARLLYNVPHIANTYFHISKLITIISSRPAEYVNTQFNSKFNMLFKYKLACGTRLSGIYASQSNEQYTIG